MLVGLTDPAAQLSRRLHMPAYLDPRKLAEHEAAWPLGQRTAPGQLQRRVRPPRRARKQSRQRRGKECCRDRLDSKARPAARRVRSGPRNRGENRCRKQRAMTSLDALVDTHPASATAKKGANADKRRERSVESSKRLTRCQSMAYEELRKELAGAEIVPIGPEDSGDQTRRIARAMPMSTNAPRNAHHICPPTCECDPEGTKPPPLRPRRLKSQAPRSAPMMPMTVPPTSP